MSELFMIVGLGNPGKSYINNKHNVGYKGIDTLGTLYHSSVFSKKFKSEFLKLEVNKNIIFLQKPTTYMNNSGLAVKEIKDFYNIPLSKIYVIHDEIDLEQGRVKVKVGGGHNGHNGLKSIDQFIGKNYNRIRVGISRPSKLYENKIEENISGWVLSDFSSNDKVNWLNATLEKVSNEINLLITNETEKLNFN